MIRATSDSDGKGGTSGLCPLTREDFEMGASMTRGLPSLPAVTTGLQVFACTNHRTSSFACPNHRTSSSPALTTGLHLPEITTGLQDKRCAFLATSLPDATGLSRGGLPHAQRPRGLRGMAARVSWQTLMTWQVKASLPSPSRHNFTCWPPGIRLCRRKGFAGPGTT